MRRPPPLTLNAKQVEQRDLITGPATHVLTYGGSRGGKTFGFVNWICHRALAAPGSRHLIARYRFNAVWRTVRLDTFPKVMREGFPDQAWTPDDRLGRVRLGQGSEIWFGGLDNAERLDKVLGAEFATIFINECSEVSYDAVAVLRTRLAQKAIVTAPGPKQGQPLRRKMFYDLNPTTRKHWTYREFVEGVSPANGAPLKNADDYVAMTIPPQDNARNLADGYLDSLAALPPLQRTRFYIGEYLMDVAGALWRQPMFQRCPRSTVPTLHRVVIAVDPSGARHAKDVTADEIGIMAVGLGSDGRAYVLEDCSLRAGPSMWAGLVCGLYHRHRANVVVVENNYGGPMAEALIRSADPSVNVRSISATSGKHVRAEPVAGLYERGRVLHVGEADFEDLEDQLMQFTVAGYIGKGSPDRADALVWALTELLLDSPTGPATVKQIGAPFAPAPRAPMLTSTVGPAGARRIG